MKQKYHVYISYHRRDSEIALKVVRILQLALYTTWMDIDPLDMPLTECQKEALSMSKYMMIIVSNLEDLKSGRMQEEWSFYSKQLLSNEISEGNIMVLTNHSITRRDLPPELRAYSMLNIDFDEINVFSMELISCLRERYVFISHSHYDFDRVRVIRNKLEENGERPLLFFLKAFETPEYEKLLLPIIEKEIDCRRRFIYCRSKNSEKSTYVQHELSYMQRQGRSYDTIDIDSSDNEQRIAVEHFVRRSNVFVSYPRSSSKIAETLINTLRDKGINVLCQIDDLSLGMDIEARISSVLRKCECGLVLIDGEISMWQKKEIELIMQNAMIVPVLFKGNMNLLPQELLKYQVLDMREIQNTHIFIETIIEYLKKFILI